MTFYICLHLYTVDHSTAEFWILNSGLIFYSIHAFGVNCYNVSDDRNLFHRWSKNVIIGKLLYKRNYTLKKSFTFSSESNK